MIEGQSFSPLIFDIQVNHMKVKWLNKIQLLKFLLIFFMLVSGLQFGAFAGEPELLKSQDVTKIMQQIFEQHLDKKEMTATILKHSFKIYLDQFDPDRVYLLESETLPFLNPSNAQMQEFMNDYQKENFDPYKKMDVVIQKAILRSRQWRQEWELNKEALFQQARKTKMNRKIEDDRQRSFASSLDELRNRNQQEIFDFIHFQTRQFGEAAVFQKEAQFLSRYEAELRVKENQYLFTNEEGKPLAANEKEHLFTLHILKALAKSLDSHTSFFNSAEAYDMRVRLEKDYDGIGIVFQEGIDGIYVSSLLPGGPAEKSGLIKIRDQIVSINGKSVLNESFQKIMEMVRGDQGSTVKLVVRRNNGIGSNSNGQLIEVTLKREKIVVNNDRVEVSSETFGDGIIGKITLHSFYQNADGVSSERDVQDAISELKSQGKLLGLILDLRENSGGYLTQAVKVAGLFITNGVVVISKYSNGEEKIYRDLDNKVAYNGPLIILTSRLTASAAEIVAEALQDYGVALVVGDERTYGKGSIQSQTVTNNQNTSFFKVTVGKYYTVSGNTPQTYGVKADIVVPSQYSHDQIGEEYLDYPLTRDTISSEYQDNLADIQPDTKSWFLKYYLPTLQHKSEFWKSMVSALKKNSEFRIAHNKNYQLFLKKIQGKEDESSAEMDEDELTDSRKPQNFGSGDLQLDETFNIIKDMVHMQSSHSDEFIGKQN